MNILDSLHYQLIFLDTSPSKTQYIWCGHSCALLYYLFSYVSTYVLFKIGIRYLI